MAWFSDKLTLMLFLAAETGGPFHVIRAGFGITVAMLILTGAMAGGAEEPADTTGVLRLPVERKLTQQLEAAATHLERKETVRAVSLLEQLWFYSREKLAGDEPVLEPVGNRVLHMLRQLPDDDQRRFWERIESAAADEADSVLLGSPRRVGFLALRRLALRLRDTGNWELAIAALDQAARHPVATAQEALLADVLRVDLQAITTGSASVRKWLGSVGPEIRERSFTVAGEKLTVEAWLNRPRTGTAATEPKIASDRPALMPRWEWTGGTPDNLRKGLRQANSELRAQGLIPLSSIQPLVVGQRVLVPTIDGLACLEAETGRIVWQTTNRAAKERATLAGQQQHNPLFSNKLMLALSQQLQTNTLIGALSHDDETVYQIVETGTSNEPAKSTNGFALEAVDLTTGQKKWRAGGNGKTTEAIRQLNWTVDAKEKIQSPSELYLQLTKPITGPAAKAAASTPPEMSICGPPLSLGDRLYVLSEQSSELIFLAIDRASLEVEWSCSLGDLLPDVSRAAPRTYSAAPLIWTGRWLVCGTNCGAIVAIDPLTESIRWVARYPAELWLALRPELSSTDVAAASALRSWRNAVIQQAGGKLICISPESPVIRVLDELTGQTAYTIPRGQGLTVLGTTPRQILVLEPAAIHAFDLTTGESQWRTVIGEVRGRGILVGAHGVQPLADGSVAVLDLETGRRLPGAIYSELAWGNLVPLPDGWVSSDEFHIRKFADVAVQRQLLADQTNTSAIEQARLDLEAGDLAAVRSRLMNAADEAARRLLRDGDLVELRFYPERVAQIRSRLLKLSITRESQGESLFMLAEAFFHERQWSRVFECCLDGLAVGLTGERIISSETMRRVRWDRAFQGLLAAAFREAEDGERGKIEQSLAPRWQAARDALDPFALQQLEQQWRSLRWTRHRLVDDAEAIFLGSSLLSRELSLLTAGHIEPETSGLRALWKLREERQSAGFPRDTEDIELRLLRESPGRVVIGEKTIRRQLANQGADLKRLQRRLDLGPADVWPATTPRVTATKDAGDEDTLQTPIPVLADADGLWDRVDVSVNRQDKLLRFSGDGQRGSWTVKLSPGQTPLQQLPLTYQGWGCGRLLIVRIGSQLLAVSPWNEQGEPDAKIVWSLDLMGNGAHPQEQLMVERMSSKWKHSQDPYRILDPVGREICRVGPVQAGYLCYLQRGKIIAVETQTGRQLWERWDIAPGAIPFGDEEHVLLWSPDKHICEVLDAADGRTIRKQSNPDAFGDVWHESHGTVWTGKVDRELTLICRDLIGQRTLWERRFSKDCLPLVLDDRTGAVLDPHGVLSLIDLRTGVTLEEPLTLDVPQPIERIIVSRDEQRWYVGVSGPVERSLDWLAAQGVLAGYRRPLLQGPLMAIRRSTRQIEWRREIAGEPWMLDQNKTTPILTQIYKLPPQTPGQGIGEGVLRLIDKRTGRDVFIHRDFNLLPYFTLDSQPDLQKLDIRTKNTNFQVDYSPPADG